MDTFKLYLTSIISILLLTINSNSQTLENSSNGSVISNVQAKFEHIAYGDVQNCDNNFSVQNQENLLRGSVPIGAPHPINRIFYEKPFGINTFVHPWFQAATCTESANNGFVEIDYVKVIQEDNYGNTSVIQTIEYGGFGPLSDVEGKLYLRAFDNANLFFYENTWTPMSNSNQSNGLLRIDVGEFPNYISHWWTERFSGSIDYRYYVEIRMKISGSIGVQMGCDYYQNMDNLDGVKEAWVSDWYGDTNGEFITITVPNYTSPGFDCKDYGFTEDGVFYFSEQFMNYSGAESLMLGGSFNKWGPHVELSYQDGYYLYNHGASLSSPQTYYLKGFYNCNNFYYLPDLIQEHLTNISDIVSNNADGFNFETYSHASVGCVDNEPPENLTLKDNTISDGSSDCFAALLTITTAGDGTTFIVENGGQVNLIAAQSIIMRDGTKVTAGGLLHAKITTDGTFCPEPDKHFLANIEKLGAITDVNIEKNDMAFLTTESDEFFSVYPNPTLGRFTIEFHELYNNERAYVEVYGMRGERILHEEISSELFQHVFNIEDQLPGIYIVRVLRGHKHGIRRLIKT